MGVSDRRRAARQPGNFAPDRRHVCAVALEGFAVPVGAGGEFFVQLVKAVHVVSPFGLLGRLSVSGNTVDPARPSYRQTLSSGVSLRHVVSPVKPAGSVNNATTFPRYSSRDRNFESGANQTLIANPTQFPRTYPPGTRQAHFLGNQVTPLPGTPRGATLLGNVVTALQCYYI